MHANKQVQSSNNQTPRQQTLVHEIDTDRRNFLGRIFELGSIIPLAGLAIRNSQMSQEYAAIDSSNAQIKDRLNTELSPLTQLTEAITEYNSAIDNLWGSYREAYFKSKQVPKLEFSYGGKIRYRVRTETYWERDANTPSPEKIEYWKNYISHLAQKTMILRKPDLIDVNSLDGVVVTTKHANTVLQTSGNLLIYGSQIALLLGYEEILGIKNQPAVNLQDSSTESKKVLRRGFFKVAGALAGIAAAWIVNRRINSRLSEGKNYLKDKLDQTHKVQDISGDSAILGHFGLQVKDITNDISSQIDLLQYHINRGGIQRIVANNMLNAIYAGNQLLDTFNQLFKNGIPNEIARACRSAIVTEKLGTIDRADWAMGNTAILIEGLSVGVAMSAVIVPLEILNHKLAQNIEVQNNEDRKQEPNHEKPIEEINSNTIKEPVKVKQTFYENDYQESGLELDSPADLSLDDCSCRNKPRNNRGRRRNRGLELDSDGDDLSLY